MKGVKSFFDFENNFLNIAHESASKLLNGNIANIQDELDSGQIYPITITSDFSVLINEINVLNKAKNFTETLWDEIRKDLNQLVDSKNFDDFIDNFKDFIKVDALKKLPGLAKDVIHMQTGLVISFGVILQNFSQLNPNDFGNGLNEYFFKKEGFETVSGDNIVRPKLPKSIDQVAVQSIGNQINAERYLRDITRIIVETFGDRIYNMRPRYGILADKYGQTKPDKKLVGWFDSFGDMAEASLLPVVEEVLNGAFGVDLNPLLAASIGTFCSVTARKTTEHSYLSLLNIDV